MDIYPFEALLPARALLDQPSVFFPAVKDIFPGLRSKGMFAVNSPGGIYLYRIEMPEHTFTTIVAGVDIRELRSGNIVPHERTLPLKRFKSKELLLERMAMIKPVLLAFRSTAAIRSFTDAALAESKPLVLFEINETIHRVCKVNDLHEIKALQDEFRAGVPRAYIADGHHRCAAVSDLIREDTAHRLTDLGRILAAFLSFDDVIIRDYNRIVRISDRITPSGLKDRILSVCEMRHLEEPAKPAEKHTMTMFLDNNWYLLRWREEILQKYSDTEVVLDATLLNQEILGTLIGIHDVANDSDVRYVEGTEDPESIESRTRGGAFVAFCLLPLTIEEVERVTGSGAILPPKSTWFEPRILNGIISKPL